MSLLAGYTLPVAVASRLTCANSANIFANPCTLGPIELSTVYSWRFSQTCFGVTSGKMMFLGNKSTWITSETPTNKLRELWHDLSIKFSRWKSYLKICIWSFNFLIMKNAVECQISNELCTAVYGSVDQRYKFKYIPYVQAIITVS